ncbi:FACTOR putative-RELATED [Salix koriyanagi]|uniref:FACTOR putative-RELATED n=1 Tax=Salix koriyanagi TaxID=2511006 RepID=A0A9Q0YU29_9ROSI|nr:FACTOR putative-RELATED [Salix koriyanagi]
MNGRDSLVDGHIGEADLYRRDPWELPDSAKIKSDDRVWYYFCRLDCKYSNSKRANRETKNGYWKLTGKVRNIKARRTDEVIGTKKTLVFQYRSPDSKKVVGTSWVIHEFHAKTSTPDQRVLVLCKLKYKADDSAANLPNDEGERIRVMVSNLENNAVQNNNQEVHAQQLQSLIESQEAGFDFPFAVPSQNHVQNNNQEVHAQQLQSLIDSQEAGFNFPFALQSQSRVQNCLSDEEDTIGFADSLLIVPDERGDENLAHPLLNDYIPSRSSSKDYVLDSSDRETYLAHEESLNLYGGHGSSKEHRQMHMAQSDDILLMGSSMDSTTATRHEQINFIQPVGVDFPRIHKPQNLPRARSFLEHEGISAKGHQLAGGILSTVSEHKVGERAKQVANMDLPKKVGIESEKDRKIVQATNAKPDVKSRSNDSAGNERRGRFIHLDTTTSSHLSIPSSLVYLLNSVFGLVLFIIMFREVLIVH